MLRLRHRANGTHHVPQHVVYDDGAHIAFLPNWHVLLGYVLVAPKEHREAVVDDFTLEEYLDLQRVLHRVGRALSSTVPTNASTSSALEANRAIGTSTGT
jgi:diadenosine tetraphosphate (Ap4A) HIT family hydrolase